MKKTFTKLAFGLGALLCLCTSSQAQTFNKTSAYDTIVMNSQTLHFNISGLNPSAWGTATLTVYYEGDFGASSEYITLSGENNYTIGNTHAYFDGSDCMQDSAIFTFPASYINTWGTDDTLKFTGLTTSNVDYFCTNNQARVKLQYNYCPAGGPIASIALANTSMCAIDGTVAVSTAPAGGTLSGPGTSGNVFDPAGFTPGTYTLTYNYTNSGGCASYDQAFVTIKAAPIATSNVTMACAPAQATLTAASNGHTKWYSDAATTQTVGTGPVFVTPSLNSNTTYYAANVLTGTYFVIDSLGAASSMVVDINNQAGDDRGGIAVTPGYVFMNGDDSLVRYDLNLQTSVAFARNDGLFSDLASGQLYTLYSDYAGFPDANNIDRMYVTKLLALNSNMTAGTSTITLSDSVQFGWDLNYNYMSGLFAGKGVVVIYSAPAQHWYAIDLTDGVVTDLGFLADPGYNQSENWAVWGLAEFDGTSYSVLYNDNNISGQISRRTLPAGTPVAARVFSDLSDMASFTYAPWNHRWYFHYEGSGQFGGLDETLGYADANDSTGNVMTAVVDCPAAVTVQVSVCTDIKEVSPTDVFVGLAPNPNNGVFSLSIQNISNAAIDVLSIEGRVVYSDRSKGGETRQMNLGDLAPGIYFVRVSNNEVSRTIKMVKQ